MAKLSIMAEMIGTQQVVAGLNQIEREVADVGKQADASFNEAQKSVEGFSGSMIKGIDAVKAFGVAMAAMVTVEVVRFLKNAAVGAFEYASKLDDLSQKLGVTTDKLQALAFAGMDSGVALEDIAAVLTRMSAAAGKQKDDIDGAAGAFEKYGIEVRNADGTLRDAVSIFEDVADVIQRTDNNTQRLTIANELLGRDMGSRLIPMLLGGADGLRQMEQQARELGIVIDADLIKQADTASDKLELMGLVIRNNVYQAMLELSPVILAVSEKLAEMSRNLTDFFLRMGWLQSESLPLTLRIRELQTELAGWESYIERTSKMKNADWLLDRVGGEAGIQKNIDTIRGKLQDLKVMLNEANKRDAATGGGVDLSGLLGGGTGTGGTGGGSKGDAGKSLLTEAQQSKVDANSGIEGQVEGFQQLQKTMESFANTTLRRIQSPLQRATEFFEQLQTAVRMGTLTVEQADAAWKDFTETQQKMNEGNVEGIAALESTMTSFVDATATGLLEASGSWGKFGEALKPAVAEIIKQLLKLEAFQMIIKSLLQLFSGGTGGGGEGITSGAFWGASGGQSAGFLSGLFATGGSQVVTRPSLIGVGELGRAERVTVEPLGGSPARGDSGGPVYILNFSNVAGDQHIRNMVREGIRQAAPTMIETTMQQVRQRNRMDPGFLR